MHTIDGGQQADRLAAASEAAELRVYRLCSLQRLLGLHRLRICPSSGCTAQAVCLGCMLGLCGVRQLRLGSAMAAAATAMPCLRIAI